MTTPRTADAMLELLREFFNPKDADPDTQDEQALLWDVLSAMRGPDVVNDDYGELKLRTTAILRHAAFPDGLSKGLTVNREDPMSSIRAHLDPSISPHFRWHIADAMQALKTINARIAERKFIREITASTIHDEYPSRESTTNEEPKS